MSHSIPVSSSGRSSGGSSSASRSHSQADKHDRRRRDKDKERVEKERVRKEHARKVLEEQKINKARRKWQKQTEFLCTIKFRNSLPDPPLGPHFLQVPLDLNKYVKYRPTTLEQNCNWKLHYERDLGVPIDVIDPRNYLLPRDPPQLAPADRALLDWKDEDHLSSRDNEDLSTSARRKKVDTSVTWLKKTVYLTNDPFDPVHQFKSEQQAQADKQKELDQEIARGGKQDRKMLIEESFMHANNRKPLVHQDSNKSHLTAEWVMPVLPDVYLWPNTYTTVMFDKDPAEDETVRGSEARKRKRANEALVCNVKRTTFEGNSHEVITGSYLMPREKRSNGAQRQEQDEEDEDDEDAFGYEFVKDYKFNILHYAQTRYDGSPHLLFVIDPETNVASYCKLSAKVDLANLPPEHGQSSTGRGAKVSRRDLSEEEMSNARKKVKGDLQMEGDFITLNNDNVRRRNGPGRGFGDDGGEDDQEEEEEDDDDDEEEEDEAGAAAAGENGHHNATVNGGLSERGEDGRTSSSWNGGTSDADHESVLSMTMESEASNVAVKGTESSEADLIGTHTDDNDSES